MDTTMLQRVHTACGIETYDPNRALSLLFFPLQRVHTACGIETTYRTNHQCTRFSCCNAYIPLAVLKLFLKKPFYMVHGCLVATRTYRLRYWNGAFTKFIFIIFPPVATRTYRLQYWNVCCRSVWTYIRVLVATRTYRLRYWNSGSIKTSSIFRILPTLQRVHTACGIETSTPSYFG